MDYKIEVDGQYYHDPLIPLDKITWQYTVVPVNYEFPKVKYEILEELYLTEDDEVEYQALKITGNITDSETKTNVKQNGLKASQYYPSGSIKIQDNTLNTEIGLKNITVRIRNWFKIDDVKTYNGSFWGQKSYSGNVDVTIIFSNEHYKMRSTLFNLLNEIDYKVANEVQKCNIVICREDRTGTAPTNVVWIKDNELWAQSTISNAVEEYYGYCISSTEIIDTPPFLNIWANRNKKDSYGGSAPMFSHEMKYYQINWDKWWSYAANILYIPVSNVLMNTLFQWFLPDVIINYNINSLDNSNEICETVFHELAHTSHFKKVGATYWNDYINYIVTYGSYGDGSGVGSGLCAISEAWGFHMGWYFARKKYGTSADVSLSLIEGFVPKNIPFTYGLVTYISGTTPTSIKGWIPAGIFHDMMDTAVDYIRFDTSTSTSYYDNVDSYTNFKFYNSLENDVRSPQQFRDRLLLKNDNLDEADVKQLFKAYYYE